MHTLDALLSHTAAVGCLRWIGLRPERREPMVVCERAELVTNRGLVGDRTARKRTAKRQVTLFQAEHLPTIASFMGCPELAPELLRRNLLVSGVNLLSLRTARFRVGSALLEGTGHCHPCSRLEETLGWGGYNACRGLGGITARILEGGEIVLGDRVFLVEAGVALPAFDPRPAADIA